MKTVKIKISADGKKVVTEVDGMAGPGCEDLTKGLVEALGTVNESEKKPEFYQDEVHSININE